MSSNHLVKILSSYDGEPIDKQLQVWHLVIDLGGQQTLCQGEFFGKGESGCEYEVKFVAQKGITCNDCIDIIKYIKKVKL